MGRWVFLWEGLDFFGFFEGREGKGRWFFLDGLYLRYLYFSAKKKRHIF